MWVLSVRQNVHNFKSGSSQKFSSTTQSIIFFFVSQVKKLGKKDTMPRAKDESKDFEQ